VYLTPKASPKNIPVKRIFFFEKSDKKFKNQKIVPVKKKSIKLSSVAICP
jgi:hypothetical protein